MNSLEKCDVKISSCQILAISDLNHYQSDHNIQTKCEPETFCLSANFLLGKKAVVFYIRYERHWQEFI